MKHLILTLFLATALTSCDQIHHFFDHTQDQEEITDTNYYASFIHNGKQHNFINGLVTTETVNGAAGWTNASANIDYKVDGVTDLSIKVGFKSMKYIKQFFKGEMPTTINSNYDIEELYFKPVFTKNKNNPTLLFDQDHTSDVYVVKTSPLYESDGRDCFDVDLEFTIFSNTTADECGIDTNCFNMFTEGRTKIKLCL